ncbi:hypothetical protein [Planobispora rosea]|uniref:hypothetical protein n=1 Tax=Planobispora rosea TaxID=35762 RepID=UPI00159F28D1|nr:hypothetical protein [Planobispora rosea]
MLMHAVLVLAVSCTAFASVAHTVADDPQGGGAGLIGCGSEGGPGCVAEARRWWNRPASIGGPRPDGGPGGSGKGQTPGCTAAPAEAPAGASDSGRWMLITCPGQPALLVRDDGPAEGGEAGTGAPAITPLMVALMGRDRFTLPAPEIGSSPRPEDPQLVRLPIWLAVERDAWHPRTATATAGGITAIAVATPARVTWTMGDGITVTCKGPGTPYRESRDDPRRPSPTCGHTYLESSADAPDAEYRVTATITWNVTWAAAGQAGTLPSLTTTATTAFRVAEAQAIVTT